MSRPTHAVVHLDHLRHNMRTLQQAAGAARVFAVIKANAYGHGIERIFSALTGADGLAMLNFEEAQLVRHLGWRGPVLMLEGIFSPRDLELCTRLDLWHVVHCTAQIDMIAASKGSQAHHVFLKMNSGMNRLGFAPHLYRSAWQRLSQLPQVDQISLMTHFANADRDEERQAALQRFEHECQDLPGWRTCANSAALLLGARQADEALLGDWVRPGIALYGSSPDAPAHSAADWDLLPTMSLRSCIIGTQMLQSGDSVGYGSVYTAQESMPIGIVAVGYADGYLRSAQGSTSHGTPVLIDGILSRTVGRVSMDMIAVDLRPVLAQGVQAGIGSRVLLWGQDETACRLDIDSVALSSGSIAYELLCGLAPRVSVTVEDTDTH